MKFLGLLSALVLFSSCNYVSTEPQASPSPTITEGSPSPTPGQGSFTFKCGNCTQKQQAKIDHAYEIILAVKKSKCFRDYMLGRHFTTTELTSAEVVEKIVNWVQVDPIPLSFYTPAWYDVVGKRVIGYTNPGKPTIYLNATYRLSATWTDYAEASNLFHETSHKMGFDHASASDGTSVPYQINRATEFCTKGDKLPE